MSIDFGVYQVILVFLQSINYNVPDVIDKKTYNDLMEDKGFCIINANKNQSKLNIIILGIDSIKSSDIVKILNHIHDICDIYTVKNNKLSSNIVKKIYEIKGKITYKNLETTCFIVDIRKHISVPKHEICSEQEREEIKNENYITSLVNIPHFFDTDPQIVWINGKIGDLIKITRRDFHGDIISYRIVIPS